MTERTWMRLATAVAAAIAVGGCYRATVRSGLPPGNVPDAYDDRWHSGWFLGAVETSGPYPLEEICKEGWAEVHTSTNLLQGLLAFLTYGIYTPQTVTVVCALSNAPHAPPVAGEAPLPPAATSAYPPSPATSAYPPPPPKPGAVP